MEVTKKMEVFGADRVLVEEEEDEIRMGGFYAFMMSTNFEHGVCGVGWTV